MQSSYSFDFFFLRVKKRVFQPIKQRFKISMLVTIMWTFSIIFIGLFLERFALPVIHNDIQMFV